MNLKRANSFQLDWMAVIIFTVLVVFGYFNILSAAAAGEFISYLDITKPYGKQLFFILSSVVLIILILSVDAKFYERFASIIYLGSILSLIGLFLFGKQINGAISWYDFGGSICSVFRNRNFKIFCNICMYCSIWSAFNVSTVF